MGVPRTRWQESIARYVKEHVRKSQPERREEILDATLRLISEHGIEGTTVARIAEAVGLTPGALVPAFREPRGAHLRGQQSSRRPGTGLGGVIQRAGHPATDGGVGEWASRLGPRELQHRSAALVPGTGVPSWSRPEPPVDLRGLQVLQHLGRTCRRGQAPGQHPERRPCGRYRLGSADVRLFSRTWRS